MMDISFYVLAYWQLLLKIILMNLTVTKEYSILFAIEHFYRSSKYFNKKKLALNKHG